jgi:hypothetical protein
MRLRITIDIQRRRPATPEPDPEFEPGPPVYDLSTTHTERAGAWDHDTRPPFGFTPNTSKEPQ